MAAAPIRIAISAPEFSERGAAVGLSGNARIALQHILPEARETLARAGAVPINSTRIVVGSGPDADTLVADFDANLAPEDKELIEHLHPSKKLIKIIQMDSGIDLAFEDGTTDRLDAVIGADGIFGSVRRYVLQDEADECAASPGGWWDSRVVVPMEKAKSTLGEQYFDVLRQYLWAGDGMFVLHDVLENGTMVQGVISAVEKDPPANRKRPLTRELLTKAFESWPDGPISKGIIDLFLDQPDPQGYSQYEHKSTPTYSNGRVCIMGDAAHATTPWQGAGAGQAFEDAVILGTLLASISSVEEIYTAFKAHDAVRRPRCQRVVDSSRGTGEIFTGQNKEVGMSLNKLQSALAGRWDFLSIDLDAHKKEALDMMKKIGVKVPTD
ncbi:FAD/NAD(P)-binding domain-containing protein [Whalleya microplaca]|nr:FAD/NAD(P)-binding domain-containing protein [Whalleya microplaca]